MLKDLPEDVRMAFNILYNFADDGDINIMTWDEMSNEGLAIDGQSCYFITLAISQDRTWEDVV